MSPLPSPAGRPSVSLLDAIRRGPLAGDGALGTRLLDLGLPLDIAYEELSVSRPDLVDRIHHDDLQAGAQVIETNSFGANHVRLARHGIEGRVREINLAAAALARRAAGTGAWVAGAVGPTGLAFTGLSAADRERARDGFEAQAAALAEGGADAILIETMGWPDEVALAVLGARRAVGSALPILAHVSVDARLGMADGTPLAVMGQRLAALGCDGVGVNCCDGPAITVAAMEALRPLGLPLSAIPSAGLPRRVGDRFVYPTTPEDFGALAQRLAALGVGLIGGCCGTTSEHVRHVAGALRGTGARTAAAS